MLEAGLFGMLAPKAHGGLELHPVEVMRVWEAVARIDSAAGWNLVMNQAVAGFAAWLPAGRGERAVRRRAHDRGRGALPARRRRGRRGWLAAYRPGPVRQRLPERRVAPQCRPSRWTATARSSTPRPASRPRSPRSSRASRRSCSTPGTPSACAARARPTSPSPTSSYPTIERRRSDPSTTRRRLRGTALPDVAVDRHPRRDRGLRRCRRGCRRWCDRARQDEDARLLRDAAARAAAGAGRRRARQSARRGVARHHPRGRGRRLRRRGLRRGRCSRRTRRSVSSSPSRSRPKPAPRPCGWSAMSWAPPRSARSSRFERYFPRRPRADAAFLEIEPALRLGRTAAVRARERLGLAQLLAGDPRPPRGREGGRRPWRVRPRPAAASMSSCR